MILGKDIWEAEKVRGEERGKGDQIEEGREK